MTNSECLGIFEAYLRNDKKASENIRDGSFPNSLRNESLNSALIRNNKPGVAAFRLANGYAGLRDALISESARFQR